MGQRRRRHIVRGALKEHLEVAQIGAGGPQGVRRNARDETEVVEVGLDIG